VETYQYLSVGLRFEFLKIVSLSEGRCKSRDNHFNIQLIAEEASCKEAYQIYFRMVALSN